MSKAGPFAGTWRIVEMELWDQDAFDLVGPARFTFGKDGGGSFRFIAIEGDMDGRFSEKDGKPRVDFTWEGNDECDPASGRGWAVLDGDVINGSGLKMSRRGRTRSATSPATASSGRCTRFSRPAAWTWTAGYPGFGPGSCVTNSPTGA